MAGTDILDALERRINKLESIAEEVEHLGKELLQNAPIERYRNYNDIDSHRWGVLNSDLANIQREAFRKYQCYYTSAFQLVQEYLPEKEIEFVEHYKVKGGYGNSGVAAYLQLENYTPSKNDNRLVFFQVVIDG